MDTVATWLGYGKPTKKEQLAKCRHTTRRAIDKIDAEIRKQEIDTKGMVTKWKRDAEKRTTIPARRAQGRRDVRGNEENLKLVEKNIEHLRQVRTSLGSLMTKIVQAEANLGVMSAVQLVGKMQKNANNEARIDLPLLQQWSAAFTGELMRSDIINELVEEAMPGVMEDAATEDEDDIGEDELIKTINEITNPQSSTSKARTPAPVAQEPVVEAPQEKLDEEKQDEGETAEALMEDMNHRLQALRS